MLLRRSEVMGEVAEVLITKGLGRQRRRAALGDTGVSTGVTDVSFLISGRTGSISFRP
jgi:hypothetical protein